MRVRLAGGEADARFAALEPRLAEGPGDWARDAADLAPLALGRWPAVPRLLTAASPTESQPRDAGTPFSAALVPVPGRGGDPVAAPAFGPVAAPSKPRVPAGVELHAGPRAFSSF